MSVCTSFFVQSCAAPQMFVGRCQPSCVCRPFRRANHSGNSNCCEERCRPAIPFRGIRGRGARSDFATGWSARVSQVPQRTVRRCWHPISISCHRNTNTTNLIGLLVQWPQYAIAHAWLFSPCTSVPPRYDIIVVGTGLRESLLALLLAQQGTSYNRAPSGFSEALTFLHPPSTQGCMCCTWDATPTSGPAKSFLRRPP